MEAQDDKIIQIPMEDGKEAMALLQLDTILRYSVVYGKPKPPKKGAANQKIFSYMLEMHYELIGIGLVKMMVGVKRTGEKVQYCITAIEA